MAPFGHALGCDRRGRKNEEKKKEEEAPLKILVGDVRARIAPIFTYAFGRVNTDSPTEIFQNSGERSSHF